MVESDLSEELRKELAYFFEKYNAFLELEAIVSFLKGREYNLIKHFYNLFLEIAQKRSATDAKAKLEMCLANYQEENKAYKPVRFIRKNDCPREAPLRVGFIKDNDLSEAFVKLTEAIELYKKWRKSLNPDAIRDIYRKNLIEKQKYYFNGNLDNLNKNLVQSQSASNNFILRQTLIEFHNGISHLNAVYWNTGDNQVNTERASHHFKRGALDSYKAIIKDFCVLAGTNDNINFIPKISSIRELEYQTIGADQKRKEVNIYTKYEGLATNIINSLKPQEALRANNSSPTPPLSSSHS